MPALVKVSDTLLMHADSGVYLDLGSSVVEVNARLRRLLGGSDGEQRDRFEQQFARRGEFLPPQGEETGFILERVLQAFGAARLVHGHTPVFTVLDRPAAEVTEPWVYQDGRCVNVDHGLAAGGRGFALSLS